VSIAPALLAAGAGVGFGHAVMPDHWMPIAVIGRVNRYKVARVARLSAMAGVAHVVFSLALGAVIVVVGLQFRSSIESAQDTIVGTILLLTGVLFAGFELAGRGHHHGPGGHTHGPDGHEHEHEHEAAAAVVESGRRQRLFTVLVPFGAAASPDLTILPVFLAAAAVGTAAAIGTLVVFSLVTVATIVTLTVVAFLTGSTLEGNWLDRWGNLVTVGVLWLLGALIITHVI
jgi:nickel/cobalt exporter